MGRCISPFVSRAEHIQPIFLDQLLDRLNFTAIQTISLRSVQFFCRVSKRIISFSFIRVYSLSKISPGSEQFEDLFGLIGGALTSGSLVRIDVVVRTIPLPCVLAGTVILVTRYRIVR